MNPLNPFEQALEALERFGQRLDELEQKLNALQGKAVVLPVSRFDQPAIVKLVKDCVAARFKLTVEQLEGASRTRVLIFPRFLAMHLIRKFTKLSLVDIGQLFSGRDHAGVAHALQQIPRFANTSNQHRQEIEALERQVASLLQ